MATYTDSVSPRSFGLEKVRVLEATLDFADIAAYRSANGLTALAANDIYQVFNINAKALVLRVGMDVTVAEGATATLAVGDGDDDDGFLTASSINSVTSYASALALTEGTPNTITGYSGGKYYSAADTIDIKLGHNSIDAAVVRVWALVVDCA
jgi:hypothetical protein